MKQVNMHIAVFCGSSLPRNKEIVEAAAVLADSNENRNNTMNISVFSGASLTSAVKMTECNNRLNRNNKHRQ